MPKGVKGYRWVETGYKVWQLEDGRPGSRHFRGCVSLISDGLYSWYVVGGPQGTEGGRREAFLAVELYVL